MTRSSNYQDRSIACSDGLALDEIPRGRTVRRLIEVGQDGLGRSIRLPIIIVRGRRPGPTFGITCALHGNELNGIPVIHRLVETLDPHALRGSVVACPVLNVPGYLQHRREFRDGNDLNHLMPGLAAGDESQAYAHGIVDRIVRQFDVLVDLHTASFGRVNSLYVRADMSDPVTARMAYLQRPRIILHNPPSDRTLRGAAAELGVPAITVEIGDPQVFQPRHIRPTLAGLRAVLAHFRMLPKRAAADTAMPLLCARSSWMYTDRGGLLEVVPEVAATLDAGELLARQVDIFGDLVREYVAPDPVVVIGKSVNPVSPTGARIAHLGVLAAPDDGLVSRAVARETGAYNSAGGGKR